MESRIFGYLIVLYSDSGNVQSLVTFYSNEKLTVTRDEGVDET